MSHLTLNRNSLIATAISAACITLGVNAKNSFKFLKQDGQVSMDLSQHWSTILGMILFVGGWAGIWWTTTSANSDAGGFNTLLITLAVVGIIAAVMVQNFAPAPIPIVMLIGFIGGWLLLGFSAGQGRNSSKLLTIPAALLVLASMTTILPLQRGDTRMGTSWTVPSAKIVDGPGYPMFMAAWALLALSNARVM